jgi:hypothetical protein
MLCTETYVGNGMAPWSMQKILSCQHNTSSIVEERVALDNQWVCLMNYKSHPCKNKNKKKEKKKNVI